MKSSVFAATILLLFPILTLPGCGDDDDTARPNLPGVAAVTVTILEGAMNLGDEAFGENPLVISRGTTVTWVNGDSVAHTVTSSSEETEEEGGEGSQETFDSGELQPGESFSHTFSTEGSFEYFCQIHPMMRGAVQVNLEGIAPSPTPVPEPTFTTLPGPPALPGLPALPGTPALP